MVDYLKVLAGYFIGIDIAFFNDGIYIGFYVVYIGRSYGCQPCRSLLACAYGLAGSPDSAVVFSSVAYLVNIGHGNAANLGTGSLENIVACYGTSQRSGETSVPFLAYLNQSSGTAGSLDGAGIRSLDAYLCSSILSICRYAYQLHIGNLSNGIGLYIVPGNAARSSNIYGRICLLLLLSLFLVLSIGIFLAILSYLATCCWSWITILSFLLALAVDGVFVNILHLFGAVAALGCLLVTNLQRSTGSIVIAALICLFIVLGRVILLFSRLSGSHTGHGAVLYSALIAGLGRELCRSNSPLSCCGITAGYLGFR